SVPVRAEQSLIVDEPGGGADVLQRIGGDDARVDPERLRGCRDLRREESHRSRLTALGSVAEVFSGLCARDRLQELRRQIELTASRLVQPEEGARRRSARRSGRAARGGTSSKTKRSDGNDDG